VHSPAQHHTAASQAGEQATQTTRKAHFPDPATPQHTRTGWHTHGEIAPDICTETAPDICTEKPTRGQADTDYHSLGVRETTRKRRTARAAEPSAAEKRAAGLVQ